VRPSSQRRRDILIEKDLLQCSRFYNTTMARNARYADFWLTAGAQARKMIAVDRADHSQHLASFTLS
jgi:hypothetical protein